MLAGGFGNYLSVRERAPHRPHSPDLPEEQIRYVGNAAALGAQLALVSEPERAPRRGDRRVASSTSRSPRTPTSRTSSWTA